VAVDSMIIFWFFCGTIDKLVLEYLDLVLLVEKLGVVNVVDGKVLI
jgi:hypothetical protein